MIRSTKMYYFQVLIMLSMSPVLPSRSTKSSELSPFALPQIPSKLPISKTEGIIWIYTIQSFSTWYFTEVPDGRVIYNKWNTLQIIIKYKLFLFLFTTIDKKLYNLYWYLINRFTISHREKNPDFVITSTKATWIYRVILVFHLR